jgi:hypothetical protein
MPDGDGSSLSSPIGESNRVGAVAGRLAQRYAMPMWRLDQPPEPDPVIEAYKRDEDRTLLRENLRRAVEEQIEALMRMQQLAEEFRRPGQRRAR